MLSNAVLVALAVLSVLVAFELIVFLGVLIVVRSIAKEVDRKN